MEEAKGVIYILTNRSFPEYVKIGYTDDIRRRLKQLNQSECIPFAFRVYATLEVSSRLSDKKIHAIIDNLNSDLRATDTVGGHKRVREFYAMTPEKAYAVLKSLAEFMGCPEKLRLAAKSDGDSDKELAAPAHPVRFTFPMLGIPVGAELEFWSSAYNRTGIVCTVADDRRVSYQGELYTLTGLAKKLTNTNKSVRGLSYYKYNGKWLGDLRRNADCR